jgi:glycosyltransferase involved in cell wall biosynthesis
MTFMSRATKFCPRPGPDRPFVFTARLGGYYDLRYYRHCHHLVGNTPDLVQYFHREGWPPERTHYLPNFAHLDPLPAYPRERLSTPADAPVILALGRLHPNKAFDMLIDALPNVPSAILWLAGAGPLEDDLREQAASRGVADRIRFLGWIDNPAPFYAACDVVAISARHEPLGNVVLEAWAAGKPVAAARSQGPGQLIRDGENGLLAAVDDAAALGEALQRLVSDPALRESLAAAGHKEYETHYTEAAVVRQYLEFFERVARDAGL